MGNYRARREGFLQGWQLNAADLMFRGFTDEEIAIKLWSIDKEDKKKLRNAKDKLRKLRKDEKFQEYYKSIITEWSVHNVGRALNRLAAQVDHEQPWIANKAANDILQRIPKSLFSEEDEDTIKVVVEGAPILGSPDDSE